MDFGVRDALVKVGKDWEDGSDIIARALYVVARAEDGRQWAHEVTFMNKEPRFDPEEGQHFWGYVESVDRGDGKFVSICDLKAAALCAKIVTSFAQGTKLDPARWTEIDPAYGSEAYQELDTMHYFRDREVMDAHEAGEIGASEVMKLVMG